MREIRPEVEKWDIDNLSNGRDEVIINRLRFSHTWITHEYLINDIVQAGPVLFAITLLKVLNISKLNVRI